MSEMTLSSRHRIRNSNPGSLRPITLPLGHGGFPQYCVLRADGEETFLFLSNRLNKEASPEPVKGSGANLVYDIQMWHDNYGWCIYVSSIPSYLEVVAVISYIYESYYPIFMKYVMLYFRYYHRLKI